MHACRQLRAPLRPRVRELKQAIDAGQYGEIYGVAWYSKGLRHNGTHLVDLLRYPLGEADEYALFGAAGNGSNWIRLDFRIRFGAPEVFSARRNVLPLPHRTRGNRRRLVYADGGSDIRARRVHDDPVLAAIGSYDVPPFRR